MNLRQGDDDGIGASIFHNTGAVSGQTGIQNVQGSVHHNTTHYYYLSLYAYGVGITSGPVPEPRTQIETPKERRSRYRKSLGFQQIEARHATILPAHSHTCRWLLERCEYREWLQDASFAEHHGLLWIKGKPGAGKSTIMKFLLTNTQKQSRDAIVVSFFFNARGDELEKSTLGLYRSLLYQLLTQNENFLSVFDTLPMLLDEAKSPIWNHATLINLFRNVLEKLENTRVLCFIDALDECDEDQVRAMLQVLEDVGRVANTSSVRFRVCLASRHYPRISALGRSLILEDQSEHANDIVKYIGTELKIGAGEIASEIKQELHNRAKGVFLWVVLVTRILNREYDKGRMGTLKKRLDDIPDSLEELFNDVLTREGEPQRELVLCLQWVLCARRVLTLRELYFAIISGVEPDSVKAWDRHEISEDMMERYILSCSKGLVEKTKDWNPKIQFIHETVRDHFLKTDGFRSLSPDATVSFMARGHDQIKQCCQSYCTIVDSPELRSRIEKSSKAERDSVWLVRLDFPLLQYALDNLLYHSEAAQNMGASQDEFLSGLNLAKYVPLYNAFYKDARLPHDVSLLYFLAHVGLPGLVANECERSQVAKLTCGEHGTPLDAARTNGHFLAFQALLSSQNWSPKELTDTEIREAVHLLSEQKHGYVISKRYGSYEKAVPLLVHASRAGHAAVVKYLLFSPLSSGDSHKDDALLSAVNRGHLATVRLLLDHGVDVSTEGCLGPTALSAASSKGHLQIVQLPPDHGADISTRGRALHAASSRGYTQILQLLLDHGTDVSERGRALYTASEKGHLQVAQLLLDHGADVSAMGCALYAASSRGYAQIVQLLLDHVADT